MEAPIDLVPTISRKDLISKREIEKEEQRKQKELLEKVSTKDIFLEKCYFSSHVQKFREV